MEINIIIKKEVVLQVTKRDFGQPLSHFTGSAQFEGATGLASDWLPSHRTGIIFDRANCSLEHQGTCILCITISPIVGYCNCF